MIATAAEHHTTQHTMWLARSRSHRFMLAMFASSAMCGLYLAYAHFVTPYVSRDLSEQAKSPPLPPPPPPRDAKEFAKRYLPQQPFAQEARYQVKSPDGFIYSQQWEKAENEKAVRFTPFAMIWMPQGRERDPGKTDTEQPILITCKSAVIEFESEFKIDHPKPGRIINATLFGDVRIAGPDGLEIRGRHFTFSDEALQIFSDHPVQFRYAKHEGTARGVQMELIRMESPPSDEMFAVSGIRSMRLRRNVFMKVDVDPATARSLSAGGQRRDSPPVTDKSVPLIITSVGPFDFNLETNIGAFRDQVRVEHQTTPIYKDSLETELLTLVFEPKLPVTKPTAPPPDAPGRFQGFETNLRLRRLTAEGENVLLVSEESTATASMQEFDYDADSRVVYMAATAKNRKVRVVQGYSELESPQIRIQHDVEGNVVSVVCRGRGSLKHRDPVTRDTILACSWAQQLKKYPDPKSDLHIIEMEPQAIVRAPGQQVGLAADFIKLWLEQIEQPTEDSPDSFGNFFSTASVTATPPIDSSTQLGGTESTAGMLTTAMDTDANGENRAGKKKKTKTTYEPKRLLALKNVAIVSPTVQGETDRLEVWIKTVVPAPPEIAMQPAGDLGTATADGTPAAKKPKKQKDKKSSPIVVKSDLVRAQLILHPGEADPEISELEAHGKVDVTRTATEVGDQSVNIRGNFLRLRNPGGTSQTAHVYGRPARIERPDFQFEGNELHLDREKNLAWVKGSGVLQMMVTKSMDRETLKEPTPLRVWWDEQMNFDGMTARFFGNVRSVMQDSQMECQEMNIVLTERMSFVDDAKGLGKLVNGKPPANTFANGVERMANTNDILTNSKPAKKGPEVLSILCKDEVTVRSREYKDNKLLGIRHARFAKFALNEQTGETEATGPGWITSWNRGKGKRAALAPTAVASANRPITTEKSDWEYWRIDFVGTTTGNVRDRSSTFNDRIVVVYGPV
ncbi:MAG: hypothetical protein O3A00_23895, partial [Planctomycetota bacterium]|nr:hypothetical protein [Planctomycetota bacterium]